MIIVRPLIAAGLLISSFSLRAQSVLVVAQASVLTLDQAEAAAIANQPRLLAAQLRARALAQRIREARAGYMPTVAFNASGVLVADTGTSTAAGNITTSSISNRFTYGGNLTQLVTDFGRTSALVGNAKYTAAAQNDIATLTRAQVRLNVREAYYQVLGAEAVLRAAQAAQANRHLISRQLAALAQSELRSTLDVNFADVLESEADLAVVRAQSTVAQQRSHLATAMGQAQPVTAALSEPTAPAEALPPAPDTLQQQAQAQRADLSAVQAQQSAAHEFALAEKRLSYPTLNALATGGEIPYHDHTARQLRRCRIQPQHRVADFSRYIPSRDFIARTKDLTGKALCLDPDNAQAHATMGAVRAIYEWRWKEGEEQIRLAASLCPQSSQVEHLHSVVLLAQGRYEESLSHADAALSIEHSSLFLRSHRVQVLHFSRRVDEAVAESRDFLDEHPDFAMGMLNYGAALLDLGRAEEALPVLERAFNKTSMPGALPAIAHAHYELGHLSEARATLAHIHKIKETTGCSPMILALGHVVVDELEQALEWLNIAFEERDYRLVLLGGIIPFDKIRNTARFRKMFQEMYHGNHDVGLR